ncbi:MAG: hypothetical protein RLZZ490_747 [Cyanobacteriota bacterium]
MLSVILAIAIIGGLIWWGWQRQNKKHRAVSTRSTPQGTGKVPNTLRRDLIRMAGSAQVADRLLNNLRAKYPGETEKWYWEKAIFDLERDRRY